MTPNTLVITNGSAGGIINDFGTVTLNGSSTIRNNRPDDIFEAC